MGCAGSKPHLLLSSTIHTNSPQKGFILFNEKTIEYLSENEFDIRDKLVQRCEAKLIKQIVPSSSKSLFRTLRQDNHNTLSITQTLPSIKSIDQSIENSNENKHKKATICSTVSYVLKYAINEFDIDNFKSSNHLSMKQIRKDIMKKHSSGTTSRRPNSLSKLNNSISNGNNLCQANNNNGNPNHNTLNLKDASKYQDSLFYKLALNTAIDEFGSFIQENFIQINDFESKKNKQDSQVAIQDKEDETLPTTTTEASIVAANTQEKSDEETSSLNEDQEKLKLKDALEVARQNFYKGKVSMVCLDKTGGYVVKELSNTPTTPTASKQLNSNDSINTSPSHQSLIVSLTQPPVINLQDTELAEFKQSKDALDEFINNKKDLSSFLNKTIESIVNYTTKSAIFNDNSSFFENGEDEPDKENFAKQLETALDYCLILKTNLDKSKDVIRLFALINECDYQLIEESILQATLSLDYVNREFKSYLKLLEESLLHQLHCLSKNNTSINKSNIIIKEKTQTILEKNVELRESVEIIYGQINALPKQLFLSKGLPHPLDVNHSNNSTISKNNSSDKMITINNNNIEHQENNTPKKEINIKKEIAFSILNLGEVLAKTIDYYSLDSKDGQDDELKELIKLSEKQAAFEKQRSSSTKLTNIDNEIKEEIISTSPSFNNNNATPLIKVILPEEIDDVLNVDTKQEENIQEQQLAKQTKDDKEEEQQINVDSPCSTGEVASSLSSPSISTSLTSPPLSVSGSCSPVDQDQHESITSNINSSSDKEHEEEENLVMVAASENEKSNNQRLQHNQLHQTENVLRNAQDSLVNIHDEIVCIVQEMSINNEECQQHQHNQSEGISPSYSSESTKLSSTTTSSDLNSNNNKLILNLDVKSSSSSSDVLNSDEYNCVLNENKDNQIVHKFINDIIENAAHRLSANLQEIITNDQMINDHDNQNINNNEENVLERESIVVFRNETSSNNNSTVGKRMSLDEELLYQLEQVDKKVKYMNETCSENEDDLDDENFDFDESGELNGKNYEEDDDDEKLFHPRTPAKIKSQVRQNRTMELREEIKQISNVIQDLVQTINVNNENNDANKDNNDGVASDSSNSICLNDVLAANSNGSNNNKHTDSEDGSQNSSSLGDYADAQHSDNIRNNKSNTSGILKRNSSINSNNCFSNIPLPIRQQQQQQQQQQKTVIKQKLDEETPSLKNISDNNTSNSPKEFCINTESFKTTSSFESFVDLSNSFTSTNSTIKTSNNPTTPERSTQMLNKSNSITSSGSSQKFRSKLPVKK